MVGSSSTTGGLKQWLHIENLLTAPAEYTANPRLLQIDANDKTNKCGYHHLFWTVSDPPTPVVYHEGQWYVLRHSKTTGKPYHDGHRVDVYPWKEVPEP
jgi:hypothetical protein